MLLNKMKIIATLFTLTFFTACGTGNIYKDFEEEDAAEDAAIELENGNPGEAIKILESALESDPDNYVLLSLLSAAYAQRGGVSMVDIALNMAESADSEDSDSQNGIAALWPFLPEATDSNISDVDYGLSLLQSIPSDERTDADNFKMAVLSTALASLELKALDTNGDGELSIEELANLSSASADTILSALSGAASAISGIDTENAEATEEAATQISSIVSEVNSSAGDTSAEQLTNYFSQ